MVEGIIEELSVAGRTQAVQRDAYVDKAVSFINETQVDLLVADLGTEQQSSQVGGVRYLKERAQALTASLGDARLVLHGTSSLSADQMQGLAADGVIRVNMWTRVAREAGQHAARKLMARKDAIEAGDFEASESRQYLYDSTAAAASVMAEVMELIGYPRLGT
jgi:fructose/tagatose bisphosphate aldolase